MRYAREFFNVDRGQALTAILIELPAQVLQNFEFDDATQVASFDVRDDLGADVDQGAELTVDELGELADIEAELAELVEPLNDVPADPRRGRIAGFFAGLFKRNGDA